MENYNKEGHSWMRWLDLVIAEPRHVVMKLSIGDTIIDVTSRDLTVARRRQRLIERLKRAGDKRIDIQFDNLFGLIHMELMAALCFVTLLGKNISVSVRKGSRRWPALLDAILAELPSLRQQADKQNSPYLQMQLRGACEAALTTVGLVYPDGLESACSRVQKAFTDAGLRVETTGGLVAEITRHLEHLRQIGVIEANLHFWTIAPGETEVCDPDLAQCADDLGWFLAKLTISAMSLIDHRPIVSAIADDLLRAQRDLGSDHVDFVVMQMAQHLKVRAIIIVLSAIADFDWSADANLGDFRSIIKAAAKSKEDEELLDYHLSEIAILMAMGPDAFRKQYGTGAFHDLVTSMAKFVRSHSDELDALTGSVTPPGESETRECDSPDDIAADDSDWLSF